MSETLRAKMLVPKAVPLSLGSVLHQPPPRIVGPSHDQQTTNLHVATNEQETSGATSQHFLYRSNHRPAASSRSPFKQASTRRG
ncbi:unnamed protein product, partial [Amoebophrya sp. A25]|eukprot:GSA25T00016660001.1